MQKRELDVELVAITRVKTRQGLLIYRPFSRQPYTQGELEGTRLLLQKLRGEALPWPDIEERLMPRRTCGKCRKVKEKAEFSTNEFGAKSGPRFCCERAEMLKGAGEKRCTTCDQWAEMVSRVAGAGS